MEISLHYRCLLWVNIAALGIFVYGASEKTEVPLFLFSGQSNMVGLGTKVSELSGDEKGELENIKIYQESEGVHKGKWLTLKPGFGSNDNQFGVELFFGRVLSDSMPDKKIAFIKDAVSGTYLGQSGGWLPPSSGGPGTLYANMMKHVEAALKSFNDAFDTSEYSPRWAGFIWHQGEFDAWNNRSLADKYEENLMNLIEDIREMAEVEDLPAIIPMIAATSMWQYNAIVREAEITVAEVLNNCDTTDTKDFALSDGIHYNTNSMKTIGTVCALRWLAMDFTKDWWKPDTIPVPVAFRSALSVPPAVFDATGNIVLFDLSGRVVRGGSVPSVARRPSASVLIETTASGSRKRHVVKSLDPPGIK